MLFEASDTLLRYAGGSPFYIDTVDTDLGRKSRRESPESVSFDGRR